MKPWWISFARERRIRWIPSIVFFVNSTRGSRLVNAAKTLIFVELSSDSTQYATSRVGNQKGLRVI